MKKRFYGIFFLLAAGFLIASQTGLIVVQLPIWKLILSVLLFAVMIESIIHVEFFGILMPIAVIMILFSTELGVQALTPWPVLGAALFGSIGLHILFRGNIKRQHDHFTDHWSYHSYDQEGDEFHGGRHDRYDTVEDLDSDAIESHVSFGSSIKYLHAQSLKSVRLGCSFGAMKVYFDQAQLSSEGAMVYVDCSFAGVELYIPREWTVRDNVSKSLGAVTKSRETRSAQPDNVLTLTGSVRFGSVEIIYI